MTGPPGPGRSRAKVRPALETGSLGGEDLASPAGDRASERPPDPRDLFGRSAEVAALAVALRSALSGSGSAWVVTGAAGIGKTAFLEYVGRMAAAEGFEVRRGRGEFQCTAAFLPWRRVFGGDRGPALIPPAGPGRGRAPRARTGAEASRSAPSELVLLQFAEQLESAAAQRPVAILLDDFQWADPESIAALRILAHRTGGLRGILVVAVQEPGPPAAGGPGRTDPWTRLHREEAIRWLPLAPLPDEAIRWLLARAAPMARPGLRGPDPIGRIVREAAGNPLSALELVSSLRGSGARSGPAPRAEPRSPPVTREGGRGPKGIAPSVRQRLEGLAPGDHELLERGSLLGPQFELGPIAGSMGTKPRQLGPAVARLVAEGWLVPDEGADPPRYRFAHELFWRGTRESLPAARSRTLGRQLAQWFQQHRPDDLAARGRLLHAAGKRSEARRTLRLAVERALARREFGPIATYLQWYRESGPRSRAGLHESARLYLEVLPELRFASGHTFEEVLTDLLGLRARPEDRVAAELWSLDLLESKSPEGLDERFVELEAAIRRLPRSARRRLRTRWEVLRAMASPLTRGPEEALRRTERALRACSAKGWAVERCRLRLLAAWALQELGRSAEALQMLERAKRDARQAGPTRELLDLVIEESRCGMKEAQGELGASLHLREVLSTRYRAAGFMTQYARSLFNLAGAQADLGDREGAWKNASESRRTAERLELGFITGMGCLAQAQVLLDQGWSREALHRSEQALDLVRGSDATPTLFTWVAENLRVRCLAETGEIRTAQARLEELGPTARNGGPMWVAPYELTRARVLERAGDLEGSHRAAMRSLEVARSIFQPRLQMEVLGFLVRWDRLHGEESRARSRTGELIDAGRQLGADPSGILRGVDEAVDRERRRSESPPLGGAVPL